MTTSHDDRAVIAGNRIAELLARTGAPTVEEALEADGRILGGVLDAWGWELTPTQVRKSFLESPAPTFSYDDFSTLASAVRRALLWEMHA